MFSRISTIARAAAPLVQRSYTLNTVSRLSCISVMNVGGVRAFSAGSAKLSVQEVEDRVLELLKNFSKTKQEKLSIDAHFVNDLGLDSLDQVEITMELEDEFNVELTDAVAEKIFTVKDAVEAICAVKHAS